MTITTVWPLLAVELLQDAHDLPAGLGVEVAGGLVGEQNRAGSSSAPGRWPPAGARRRRAGWGGGRGGGTCRVGSAAPSARSRSSRFFGRNENQEFSIIGASSVFSRTFSSGSRW